MMQTIKIKTSRDYHLWAPHALIGTRLKSVENVLVKIKKGRIISHSVLPKSLLPKPVLRHPGFYSLEEGVTLMPALIDAHVHLALDGKDYNRVRASWDDRNALQARIRADLEKFISSGIGAVRDGGDCRGINLQVKSAVESGQYPGPLIKSTGRAIRVKGGYGSFLGFDYDSGAVLPRLVDQIGATGADQLKVVVSGVVSFIEYGTVKGPLMPAGDLGSIVLRARDLGLKVMAHASSAAAVDLAVQAGVDSIEHGYFVTPGALQAMAEKQIAWIPTVIPVAAQAGETLHGLRTPLEINVITRTCEEQIRKLKYAHQLGVPLGVGTDSGAGGVSHACNLVEEMLLYKTGSLDNRAVLQAAVSTNADIIGLGQEYGALEAGYRAALIAVRGNPLRDIAALKEVAVHLVPQG